MVGFGDVVARMHPPGHGIIAFRWGVFGDSVSLCLGLATLWRFNCAEKYGGLFLNGRFSTFQP